MASSKGLRFTLGLLAGLLSVNTVFAAETYTFDSNHSFIFWHVNHMGFSNQSGKWPFNGTVTLDEKNPAASHVEATIKTADIISGVPKLDEHLKSKDFLNSQTYPVATFTSHKVVLTGKDKAKVEGDITLLGITKPLTLTITLNKKALNPMSSKMSVGFSGSAEVKRSEFNNTTYNGPLSDVVKFDIEAEASLNS